LTHWKDLAAWIEIGTEAARRREKCHGIWLDILKAAGQTHASIVHKDGRDLREDNVDKNTMSEQVREGDPSILDVKGDFHHVSSALLFIAASSTLFLIAISSSLRLSALPCQRLVVLSLPKRSLLLALDGPPTHSTLLSLPSHLISLFRHFLHFRIKDPPVARLP
jgi:hypothetical protein